ncbi:apoptosis inhibitor 5-A [Sitophilus oryzae]|uniref:Apoptosis inhibitor 5-A n=1 Tax=Sitophilus oryzae TaxID=7048 RepID=A0A6J2YWK0_SITOR|nr:apoptosis inhibitor 5-A [Sitophilus oryzae]
MVDQLKELYEKYELLASAKDAIGEHENVYLECVDGTKGGTKEKKLAAQIISKFFKHFPSLQDQSLNAILDLCEDGDSDIRICAMKTLPILCKDNKDHVTNIASILSQLLQLEDQDYTTACNALTQVFKEDPISAAKGILTNVQAPSDETIREKSVTFLYKKLTKVQGKLSTELEDLLIDEGKKLLRDSTSNEFMVIIEYLKESKLVKTTSGQQELVDLVAERIEINESFNPFEEGSHNVDRLVLCVNCILPLFNANIESTKFLLYYINQVLPQWDSIGSLPDGDKIQLRLLRQLAELSAHCGNIDNIAEILEKIFNKLKEYMPLPPEDVNLNDVPNLDFTSVECLLYTFHKLARKFPEFLIGDPDLLKDFRSRLQYFSRGVQGCKRGLDNTLNSKKENLTEDDQEKIKLAPSVLDNINSIIKDLFYQPPLYKCNVQLSFKKELKQPKIAEKPTGALKRHIPITFDSSNGTPNSKQGRTNKSGEERKLYAPPSGKFSSGFGRSSNRGGWNRGSGGNRGPRSHRGGSRNWRN